MNGRKATGFEVVVDEGPLGRRRSGSQGLPFVVVCIYTFDSLVDVSLGCSTRDGLTGEVK